MRVVIQRVKKASVCIDDLIFSQIDAGLLLLVGFQDEDKEDDLEWMTNKIIQLRIFNDEQQLMNRSVIDEQGAILVVSQFTLYASTKKGNRPSFIEAAKPPIAIPLYEKFIYLLQQKSQLKIETGKFGADMEVSLINDGPVTILIDSKNKY
jgi:D-aminoacyl-tRNA deacylase